MKGEIDQERKYRNNQPSEAEDDIHNISRDKHVVEQSTDQIIEEPEAKERGHEVAS